MNGACNCGAIRHTPKAVVLTGGPGGGKTAVLEVVRKNFCPHVAVLPEAASIVFKGGFPRHRSPACIRAAQRAIFHVQSELERMVHEEGDRSVILCDRGTIDGLAYWPGDPRDLLRGVGTTLEDELRKYEAVIHLRVPPDSAYDRQNPLRIETAEEAAKIDLKILELWGAHPRRFVVEHTPSFVSKVERCLGIIAELVPPCCRPR